jgi:AcrR family transcriptional regulator
MSAVVKKGPGRPKDESLSARRREEILSAAARLFAERGYSETDIDSVAEALSIGKGTIYRYFASKRELFFAAVDDGMRQLHEAIRAEVEGISDPLELIERAIAAFLKYFAVNPLLVELFIQERAQFKERQKPTYFMHHDANAGPRRELYEQLVAAGRVRELSLAQDFSVVNDLLYGTILANHVTGRSLPHEEQARSIVDLVFYGILTDAERQRRTV